jgi:hypothetical protein
MLKVLLYEELLPEEIKIIKNELILTALLSPLNNLFWLEIPKNILTNKQKKLLNIVEIFKISIEIGKTWVKFELLIRTNKLDNQGGIYLTDKQFDYVYKYAEKLINKIQK